jgi:hypothetical protein
VLRRKRDIHGILSPVKSTARRPNPRNNGGLLLKPAIRSGPVMWVVLVALAVMTLALVGWRWSGGSREGFAVWLEAVATVAAVVAAVAAGTFAARAVRIEQDRDNRWIAQQRSSQATRIAAWVPRLETEERDGVTVLTGVYVRLRNVSDVPVSRVVVKTALVWPTPNGGSGRMEFGALDLGVLPPLEPADGLTEPRVPIQPMRLPGGAAVEVQLSFVDAGGHPWIRLPDGQLFEG